MKALLERGERAGARRAAAACARIETAASHELPADIEVMREGSDLLLSGRRLRARALNDVRLRGFGPFVKGLAR